MIVVCSGTNVFVFFEGDFVMNRKFEEQKHCILILK